MQVLFQNRVLDGFLMKHVVSYRDMINDIEQKTTKGRNCRRKKFNDSSLLHYSKQ
jgi:hypothetical protein